MAAVSGGLPTPAGFNITQITGPHNTPTEIQLREVTKCSIDAYAFWIGGFSSTYIPDRDGVVNKNPTAYWGCNDGYSNNSNFGKIFSSIKPTGFYPPFSTPSTVINGYTAIPSHNYTLHKNYCAITLNMKTGKSCDDVSFGDDDIYFKDSTGNRIRSAFSVTDLSSIKVKCGTNTNLITYPITNSMVTFNPDSNPPTIEFTPNNNEDLGCSYQHNGTNYVAFSCGENNDSVEAVEYRCGL